MLVVLVVSVVSVVVSVVVVVVVVVIFLFELWIALEVTESYARRNDQVILIDFSVFFYPSSELLGIQTKQAMELVVTSSLQITSQQAIHCCRKTYRLRV